VPLVLLLVACGAGRGRAGGSTNVITRQQLEALETMSAYDAIQRLRPTWLRSRGPTSLGGGPTLPRLHINTSRSSGLEELRTIPIHEVETMEYIGPGDATTLYGTGYPGGVIEVRTRR
jgi:hypothetical protein